MLTPACCSVGARGVSVEQGAAGDGVRGHAAADAGAAAGHVHGLGRRPRLLRLLALPQVVLIPQQNQLPSAHAGVNISVADRPSPWFWLACQCHAAPPASPGPRLGLAGSSVHRHLLLRAGGPRPALALRQARRGLLPAAGHAPTSRTVSLRPWHLVTRIARRWSRDGAGCRWIWWWQVLAQPVLALRRALPSGPGDEAGQRADQGSDATAAPPAAEGRRAADRQAAHGTRGE